MTDFYDIKYAYVKGYFDRDIIEATWDEIRLNKSLYMTAYFIDWGYN